jgi:hypothetical protein
MLAITVSVPTETDSRCERVRFNGSAARRQLIAVNIISLQLVGLSLVMAAGVRELVTPALAHMRSWPCTLREHRRLLTELKERLFHNRQACPLFDSRQFCRHIEAAYAMMWDLWQRGECPRSFAVS